jgi:outer membrane protein assembly factor BamB
MYVTTARETVALDAATCRQRWRYTSKPKGTEGLSMNRGVAIKDGYVVRGTGDGYLLALDALDGKLLWARRVAQPDSGEMFTMAPLVYQDMVVIAPAVSEFNVQGWIGAFRLNDGTPVWRFNTVPRPGEPGAETWANPTNIPMGGGGVWTPLTLDPDKGSQGWLTAVDASSGTVLWRYRSAKPMVGAVTTTAGGLVFTGEQTGDFLALDAATGTVLYRFYTGSGILGGVVTYTVHGKQFVAATSGGGSIVFGKEGSPTVFVLAFPDRR